MLKYLYIDTETTGISPSENAIVQISGIIEIDATQRETFNFSLKPHDNAKIDPMALEANKLTLAQIATFPPAFVVFEQLLAILHTHIDRYNKQDKLFFVAYNAPFDADFMRAFFKRNNSSYFSSYFFTPAIDVMVLAMEYLKHQRALMPDFKLATVAKTLGLSVESDKLHNALYDITLTKMVYDMIRQDAPPKDHKQEVAKGTPKTYYDTLF